MKNELKKFLTLGAALAGSALMVSCDGSDGQNGQNGTNGIDGNSPNLPVAAPSAQLLPLARINAIIDTVDPNAQAGNIWPSGQAITAGDEFLIDFDSASFADFQPDSTVNNVVERNRAITYTGNGATFTTVVRNANSSERFSGNFTVTSSLDKTLVGTFTGGTAFNNAPVNINSDPADVGTPTPANAAITDSAVSGTASDLSIGTGSTLRSVYTLATGQAVIGQGGNAYISTNVNGSNIDVTTFDPNTTLVIEIDAATRTIVSGGPVNNVWKRVVVRQGVATSAFSGTFRLDLNPSQGGVDEITVDGLNQ